MAQNIFLQYLNWRFFEMPKNILVSWRNFLKFGLNFFSLPLLLKTLFSPWHKYTWAYPKGFNIGKYFEVFIQNLISRILGLILRIFLLFLGILTEIFLIFVGLFTFFGWLVLPILLLGGLYFGFKIMF